MLVLIKKIKSVHQHPFHSVNASLWPLSLFNFFLVILGYFNYYSMASITWDLVSFTWILYSPIFLFFYFFMEKAGFKQLISIKFLKEGVPFYKIPWGKRNLFIK